MACSGRPSRKREGAAGVTWPRSSAALEVRDVEPIARARDAHVEQASLFFDVGRRGFGDLGVGGPAVRELALHHADQEHRVKLESLGAVQGGQRDLVGLARLSSSLSSLRRVMRARNCASEGLSSPGRCS